MRKSLISAAAIAAAALVLAACGGDTTSTETPTETTETETTAEGEEEEVTEEVVRDPNADLVIWADEGKAPSIREVANAYGDANGISVVVQVIVDTRSDFITANQAGNGPDVVVGAHDWLGQFVANGSVSPLQVDLSAYEPQAVAAATYEGQTYAVPYGQESLVLYCNNEVAPGAPFATLDDALAAGADAAVTPLVVPTNDAYHMQPLYTSAGGYIFGWDDATENWDPTDLGFAAPAGIGAAEVISGLGEAGTGALRTSIDGTNAGSIFLDGDAGCFVSGPWNYNDINETYGPDGFTMQPVPGFAGMDPAEPFLGVNQFYVASNAQNPTFAQDFLTSTQAGGLNTAEAQRTLYDLSAQPPVMTEVADQVRGESPSMAIFLDAAAAARPMPAIPAMDSVWAIGEAWNHIIGGADPAETMESAAASIAQTIAES